MADAQTRFRPDQREGMATALTPEESGILERYRREYTEEHGWDKGIRPPESLTPLEETTKYGAPIYLDIHGHRHSESTVTFSILIDGREKWVTIPSIWPGKNQPTGSRELPGQFWSDDKLKPFVKKNISKDKKSFINPMTQERMPVFDTSKEAEKFASERAILLYRDE